MIVGIDLGTTHSLIGVYDANGPQDLHDQRTHVLVVVHQQDFEQVKAHGWRRKPSLSPVVSLTSARRSEGSTKFRNASN